MPYAVFRQYTSPALADALDGRGDEVREVMGSILGFRSWSLMVNTIGTLTITVCDTREGAQESINRASDWIRNNLPELEVGPPTVTDADARMRITTSETLP